MLNTRIKCCQILELNTIWFLFENLCIRDLRIYADFLDGNIYHYRDKNGLECDAVIHLRNGSYGLIEIKLGGDTAIEEAVKSLKKNIFPTNTMCKRTLRVQEKRWNICCAYYKT